MVGGTALEDVDESGSTVRRLGVVAKSTTDLVRNSRFKDRNGC